MALLVFFCCRYLAARAADPVVNNMRNVGRAVRAAATTKGGQGALSALEKLGAASAADAVGAGAAGDWGGTGRELEQTRKNSSATALAKELSRPEAVLNPLTQAMMDANAVITTTVRVGTAGGVNVAEGVRKAAQTVAVTAEKAASSVVVATEKALR